MVDLQDHSEKTFKTENKNNKNELITKIKNYGLKAARTQSHKDFFLNGNNHKSENHYGPHEPAQRDRRDF